MWLSFFCGFVCSIPRNMQSAICFVTVWCRSNRPVSQIPQCNFPISHCVWHNAPFRTELCTFLFWMVHCGIWDRRDMRQVGFVNLTNFDPMSRQSQTLTQCHEITVKIWANYWMDSGPMIETQQNKTKHNKPWSYFMGCTGHLPGIHYRLADKSRDVWLSGWV